MTYSNEKHLENGYPWLGMDDDAVKNDLQRHYHLTLGRGPVNCGDRYQYEALALTVRDRLVERWRRTRERNRVKKNKRVAYLSMEFLMGRALNNAVQNLDMEDAVRQALTEFGCGLEELVEQERDAGLGNGGLGRLAACFLDSCATLGYPITGYGIRYDYGIFRQRIKDGYQVEIPDHWLEGGSPWELIALESTREVRFGGHTEHSRDEQGRIHVRWTGGTEVLAIPHDVPVPGYRNDTVLTLRLWKADSSDKFGLSDFNAGELDEALAPMNEAAQISMILYPNDVSVSGKVLRLRQQYFLASASLQDVIYRWLDYNDNFKEFADKNCFQLNDTHPAVAVPELMRLLMDVHGMSWSEAWEITTSTMAYTNHTLLPEALETWSVRMFGELLPRPMEIIHEINRRFLEEVERKWPGDEKRKQAMSIIEQGDEPCIRMAYLAIVGSFSVNGVAELHTRLLESGLFANFYALWPQRFNNKTNGVTPRRWLAFCNKDLASLITDEIGDEWITHTEELEQLKPMARDPRFRRKWGHIKSANKKKLTELVLERSGVAFDPEMMFDVQVKRIHEYKRQLLNVLHLIHRYRKIRDGETDDMQPRCVLIGGKAAPGYAMAKLIIKLINNVASVINRDERARPHLRVAFLPNFEVTAMECICPGTDLSEQISTAGKEASGTGNMKFMMNGALTIGTLDGANIEIRDAVGADNFFLFGLTAEEVAARHNNYDPDRIIAADDDLAAVMALLESDLLLENEDKNLFRPVVDSIRATGDPWMTAADFRSYVDMQERVDRTYRDQDTWIAMSIMNCACSGYFSSDRTIRDYARDIWKLE